MQRLALVALFLVGVCGPTSLQAYAPDTLARAVGALIPNAPLMVEVARCESGLRQFDASGKPLRGGLGGHMIGLFQFHEKYHRSAALSLGYNLDTLLGNIAYARVLHGAQGTTLGELAALLGGETRKLENQETAKLGNQETRQPGNQEVSETTKLAKTLRFGVSDPEVRELKRLLARAGFATEAAEAPTYFGVSTYKSLVAFQCAKSIACLRDPKLRAGVGIVDERTLAALRS